MKIYKTGTDKFARKILPNDGDALRYQVFPRDRPRDANGKKLNKSSFCIYFENVQEAAKYLIDNPGAAIRMHPDSAIISKDIHIACSEAEPEPANERVMDDLPAGDDSEEQA